MRRSAPPELDIRVLSSDGRTFMYLRGHLDTQTAAVLRESLAGLIGAGARHVVLDLDQLSFMGASGLGVLVGAAKRIRGDGGVLVIRSARPSVQRIVEITGLGALLAPA